MRIISRIKSKIWFWFKDNPFIFLSVIMGITLISSLVLIIYMLIVKEAGYEMGFEYFSLVALVSSSMLVLSLDKLFEKDKEHDKEKAILEVFNVELNENKIFLESMFEGYKKYQKDKDITFFGDLSVALAERVLRDVTPKKIEFHRKIERFRSMVISINNFNREVRERPRLYPREEVENHRKIIGEILNMILVIQKDLRTIYKI